MAPAARPKKKSRQHARPPSTAQISQPAVQDISSPAAYSSFSPAGGFFAYVSLAVDKHRLRVYNAATGQAIADHIVDTARISSMTWCALDATVVDSLNAPQPSKKKKRKRDSASEYDVKNKMTEIVVLGLSDGTILCFSPSHARVLHSLSHPSSASAILATAVEEHEDQWLMWASGADSTLRLWNIKTNDIIANWKNDDRIPYTSLTIRPNDAESRTDILAASHGIHLLSKSASAGETVPNRLQKAAIFTGHASPVKSTKWDLSKPVPTRLFSLAESDRIVYVWDILDSPDVSGKAVASIPLDSDARSFAIATSTGSTDPSTLLALSASGKITLYHIPNQISPANTSSSSSTLPTIHFQSCIIAASERTHSPSDVIGVSFVLGRPGSICIARLVRGIRPVFTTVVHSPFLHDIALKLTKYSQRYLDDAGRFIENIQLKDTSDLALEDEQSVSIIFVHFQKYYILITETSFHLSCSSFSINGIMSLLLQLVLAWK
jgi:U3 small nucleolar RNA-associated protein 5